MLFDAVTAIERLPGVRGALDIGVRTLAVLTADDDTNYHLRSLLNPTIAGAKVIVEKERQYRIPGRGMPQ